MSAVAAMKVPAAANGAAPGCRVMAVRESDKRELERVRRARRMCITLGGGLHDAPSNEKCCSWVERFAGAFVPWQGRCDAGGRAQVANCRAIRDLIRTCLI